MNENIKVYMKTLTLHCMCHSALANKDSFLHPKVLKMSFTIQEQLKGSTSFIIFPQHREDDIPHSASTHMHMNTSLYKYAYPHIQSATAL